MKDHVPTKIVTLKVRLGDGERRPFLFVPLFSQLLVASDGEYRHELPHAGRQKCLAVNHQGNGEVGWRPGAGHDACHGLIKVRPQPSNPAMSRVATAAPATKAVAAISASKASMGLPAWRRRMTISA